MLLRFRTANVRSLRDEQELSFVVPPGEESDAARTVRLSDGKPLGTFPVIGVFGANRGATELYPLSDFDPKPEEDLEDSYLAGAYGDVPNVDQGQIGRKVLTALAGEAERS